MSKKVKAQLPLLPEPPSFLDTAVRQAYGQCWQSSARCISGTARRLGVSFPTARKHLIRFGFYSPPK